MKPYLFNILLGLLALIVLLTPFTGKVYDGRYAALKKIRLRGWIVLGTFLVSILVTYLKDDQTEKADSEKNAAIVHTFTHALAANDLKYDSAAQVIRKIIRDSTKKEINLIYGNHPELGVDNISLDESSDAYLHFRIALTSRQATAYHVHIKTYAMVILDQKKYLVDNFEGNSVSDAQIPQDKRLEITRQLDGKNDRLNQSSVFYFLVKCTYNDLGNRKFQFRSLYSYTIGTRQFGATNEPLTTAVIAFFRAKGINY